MFNLIIKIIFILNLMPDNHGDIPDMRGAP
jgi:hypothetical protein